MKTKNHPTVTVIIATTLSTNRIDAIKRAITSIDNQNYPNVKTLIVANGQLCDAEFKNKLMNENTLSLIYLDLGNYPNAVIEGRKVIDSEYFCFLDDDDELTVNSITDRVEAFLNNPDLDVVVGNGQRIGDDTNSIVIRDEMFDAFRDSPIESLMLKRGNWLASCAGLFKTKTITEEFFYGYAKYAEWSYLAAKLAVSRNIELIQSYCYKINYSAQSLSSSEDYELGVYSYLKRLRELNASLSFKRKLKKKITNYEHSLSEYYKRNGNLSLAWKYHLLSLCNIYGLKKYLLYSRRLF